MGQITNKIENFEMFTNENFLEKARELEPQLHSKRVFPSQIVSLSQTKNDWIIDQCKNLETLAKTKLAKGDSVCVDFGNHQVGYINFTLNPVGSPPDAPAHIRIKFGEIPYEIGEESSSYHGSISSSWIQEEFLHVDILPAVISLPRRYAFRYVEIKVLDTSPKYQIVIENMFCTAVTSGDSSQVAPLPDSISEDLKKIDTVALKTMEDCMQSVFEDGPKRDRRLWIGDLRLQALTNYETFKNYDLVKRCMYLFAGLTQNEHHVGACLFLHPTLLVDDTSLFDYGLFFISCLYDYYQATHDRFVLKELWATAYHQAELAAARMDGQGIVRDSDDWWCFLDWHEELNKQAGAQGVMIYTFKQALSLARILENEQETTQLTHWISIASKGAVSVLWDREAGFFVSGKQRQISWASQIWMVLADIFPKEKNQWILEHLIQMNPSISMITPYMYHYFIDALIQNDKKEEALKYIRSYWGQMVKDGVDCFWELYNPKDKYVSPYGSRIINSYCHAWSCTPSYFIRKYFS